MKKFKLPAGRAYSDINAHQLSPSCPSAELAQGMQTADRTQSRLWRLINFDLKAPTAAALLN